MDIPNVPHSGLVAENIGYVNLTTYTRDAGANVARALENPLRNALKYAREFIKVDWYREGQEWVMTIRDDGPGVPDEQQALLFQPFFRVDDARNAKTGGTGLGLAIVKHVLSRHQGDLLIDSEPGRGSRFTACFPARRLVS